MLFFPIFFSALIQFSKYISVQLIEFQVSGIINYVVGIQW
uniref:Sugar ABC transporter permease n=1 Tax=Syphacia muris TaxID=451379 RepID=A0A0N5AWF7_9BILA